MTWKLISWTDHCRYHIDVFNLGKCPTSILCPLDRSLICKPNVGWTILRTVTHTRSVFSLDLFFKECLQGEWWTRMEVWCRTFSQDKDIDLIPTVNSWRDKFSYHVVYMNVLCIYNGGIPIYVWIGNYECLYKYGISLRERLYVHKKNNTLFFSEFFVDHHKAWIRYFIKHWMTYILE